MSLNDKKHFLKDVFTVRIRADLSFETWSVTDRVKETTGIRERAFSPTLVDKGSTACSLF